MTPDPTFNPPCVPCRSSCGPATAGKFRHSFIIRASGFVILFAALLAAGCISPKPNSYILRGRVLDAETGHGLDRARLRLRALVPASLGPKMLAAYGLTGPDGAYELELGAGFTIMRGASRIRVDAGKPGYETGGADVAAPANRQSLYLAPDITLRPETPTAFPAP
jgi:hypothetical protein